MAEGHFFKEDKRINRSQEKKQMTRVDSNENTRLHTYPIKKRSGLESCSPWRLRSWPAGRYLLIRMPTVNPLQTNPVSPDGFLCLTSHRLYLLISVNLWKTKENRVFSIGSPMISGVVSQGRAVSIDLCVNLWKSKENNLFSIGFPMISGAVSRGRGLFFILK